MGFEMDISGLILPLRDQGGHFTVQLLQAFLSGTVRLTVMTSTVHSTG